LKLPEFADIIVPMAEFNLVQAVFDRSALTPNEDVAVVTMHIRKHISLAPDVGPITDTERSDFSTKFQTFFNAIKSNVSSKVVLRELRYYDVPSGPGIDMGPPKKIEPFGIGGLSAAAALPPQCAVSVTFKTSVRKQWGRFYLPGFVTSSLDVNGRLAVANCTAIANAAGPLCSRAGTGANLTIFSRVGWNDHDVQLVQVDDIVDVIRRRRFSQPLTRATKVP
jgi:hypothetical protein